MLVLTRKQNEWIELRFEGRLLATITVGKLGSSSVKIGVDALREIDVLRGELVNPQPSR